MTQKSLTLGTKPQESDPVQEVISIIFFILFCLACIASYRFSQYYVLFIGFSGVCWYLDLVLSKRNYTHKLPIHVTFSQDCHCQWQIKSESPRKFHISNLIGIGISQTKILSGAFQVKIAQPWHIFLLLKNGSNLIIYEESKTTKALGKAKELSEYLQLPLTFLDAADLSSNLDLSHNPNPQNLNVKIQKKVNKWHISSQWNNASSKYFFAKVINESGFLLFTIILTDFMTRFGKFIDIIITTYRQEGLIYLDFSNLLLSPSLQWLQVLWVAIAVLLMIWKGIQISQVKHIYINSTHLTYGINHQPIAQLDMTKLSGMTLIDYPEPLLLIFDRQEVIEIRDLLIPKDYQDMFIAIESGLREFQPKATND